MNLGTHTWKLLRYACTGVAVAAVGLMLAPRTAHAQALQVMFTLGDSTGTAGDNYQDDAVNSPVSSVTASSGATNTVYIWGIVSDAGVADTNLGIDTIYFGGESAVTGNGAFSTGTGVGVTAQTQLSPWNTLGHTGTMQDLNGDGITDVGSTSTSTTTGKSGSFSASNNPGTYSLGGSSGSAVTATSMPYGSTSGSFTGGWAFLIGEFTFTEGTVSGATNGTTSFNPFVPKFSAALVDTWTTTGSGTGASTAEWTALTGVSFTTSSGGGNTSVLNLTPATNTVGVLQNGTAPALSNLSLAETSGSGTATYTGVTTGNFSVAPSTVTNGGSSGTGASGTVVASGSLSLPVTYTGSTATDGTFTGSYTVSNTAGSTATQGNLSSALSVVVGGAAGDEDSSGTGSFNGTVFQGTVANGGSYAGLASSSNGGTKAANSNTALPGIEGSTATILGGTNNQGGSVTVSMTWRSRTLTETPKNDNVNGAGWPQGTPTSPPLPNGSQNPLGLISDVVDLYGMSSSSGAPTGTTTGTVAPTQVDPFAFEMSFNPATFNAAGASGNQMASHGQLFLASLMPFNSSNNAILNGGTPYWINTIVGNFSTTNATATATYPFGPNNTAVSITVGNNAAAAMEAGNSKDTASAAFTYPILETFDAWSEAEFGTTTPSSTQLAPFLGVWGVDTTGDEAWAVINHNSEFAVVPEPSTIALIAIGLVGIGLATKKRKKLEA